MPNKHLRILIPGCGNAYEAEYLHHNRFTQVYLVDVAPEPLQNFAQRVPDFPKARLLQQDYFELQDQYDLIVEQTFFCALHPDLRAAYARKTAQLLKPGGKLMGLLFDTTFSQPGPPFGGNSEEYRAYFAPYFEFIHFGKSRNSIKPRQGRELFIILQKRADAEV